MSRPLGCQSSVFTISMYLNNISWLSIHQLVHQGGLSAIQFSSVTQSCPTLCNPMNCSTPGYPVHHQLPEFTQTHAHRVGEAIQPSHPLSSPSPPAPNPSQHQGLFQWVSSLHKVAKVLEFQLQHESFQWTPRTDLLQYGLVGSPCSPVDSQESAPTPQFKSLPLSGDKNGRLQWAFCLCIPTETSLPLCIPISHPSTFGDS